jgi:hypothetical protein
MLTGCLCVAFCDVLPQTDVGASDVWQKLLHYCASIDDCQPLLLRHLLQQDTKQRDCITGMLKKLTHDELIQQAQQRRQAQQQAQLQKQVVQLQEQNRSLQQQVGDLQQKQQAQQQQQQQQQQRLGGEMGVADEVAELCGHVGLLER